MFDIKWIRDNPADFDAAMVRRGLPPPAEQVLALDAARRDSQTKLQDMQQRRNEASKAIGDVKRVGGDASDLMAEVAGLKDHMAAAYAESTARLIDIADIGMIADQGRVAIALHQTVQLGDEALFLLGRRVRPRDSDTGVIGGLAQSDVDLAQMLDHGRVQGHGRRAGIVDHEARLCDRHLRQVGTGCKGGGPGEHQDPAG